MYGGQSYDTLSVQTNGFLYFGYQTSSSIGIYGSNGAALYLGVQTFANVVAGQFVLRGLPEAFEGQPAALLEARGVVVKTLPLATNIDLSGLAPRLYEPVGKGVSTRIVLGP